MSATLVRSRQREARNDVATHLGFFFLLLFVLHVAVVCVVAITPPYAVVELAYENGTARSLTINNTAVVTIDGELTAGAYSEVVCGPFTVNRPVFVSKIFFSRDPVTTSTTYTTTTTSITTTASSTTTSTTITTTTTTTNATTGLACELPLAHPCVNTPPTWALASTDCAFSNLSTFGVVGQAIHTVCYAQRSSCQRGVGVFNAISLYDSSQADVMAIGGYTRCTAPPGSTTGSSNTGNPSLAGSASFSNNVSYPTGVLSVCYVSNLNGVGMFINGTLVRNLTYSCVSGQPGLSGATFNTRVGHTHDGSVPGLFLGRVGTVRISHAEVLQYHEEVFGASRRRRSVSPDSTTQANVTPASRLVRRDEVGLERIRVSGCARVSVFDSELFIHMEG